MMITVAQWGTWSVRSVSSCSWQKRTADGRLGTGAPGPEVELPALLGAVFKCFQWIWHDNHDMAVCQNLVPLVNIKIAGKWMFIPLKMVLIGIDPYPYNYGKHLHKLGLTIAVMVGRRPLIRRTAPPTWGLEDYFLRSTDSQGSNWDLKDSENHKDPERLDIFTDGHFERAFSQKTIVFTMGNWGTVLNLNPYYPIPHPHQLHWPRDTLATGVTVNHWPLFVRPPPPLRLW